MKKYLLALAAVIGLGAAAGTAQAHDAHGGHNSHRHAHYKVVKVERHAPLAHRHGAHWQHRHWHGRPMAYHPARHYGHVPARYSGYHNPGSVFVAFHIPVH